jgi:hypothetical protein
MTDTSLFYESDVTTRSGYGSAPRVLLLRPRSGTPMTSRTTTPDVDVSRHEEQIDRQPLRSAIVSLMKDCCMTVYHSSSGSRVAKEYDLIS